jgi:hypothetical protein
MLRGFPDTRDVNWLVLDVWNWADPYGSAVPIWKGILEDTRWETVVARDGILVLRRGQGPPQDVAAAFARQGASSLKHLEVRFGDTWRLTGAEVFPLPLGHFILCTAWQGEMPTTSVRPEVRLRMTAKSQPLRSYALLPELYASPGTFRDCTQLLAATMGAEVTVWLTLTTAEGSVLTPSVVSAGDCEGDVYVDDVELYLEIPVR